jgi:predicted ABC-type ATPase
MKTYTIVAGVNGTGKSSLSGVLRAQRSDLGHIIDVDKIAVENGYSQIGAGRAAIVRINGLLSAGLSLTQETTLSGHRAERLVKAARDSGYFIRLFYIGLNSCEESVKRIKNRVEKGGHGIDGQTVINRFSARFDSLLRVLPFCDEAYFYDNENGFVEVAEYRNGELIIRDGIKPPWLRELAEKMKREKI